MTQNEQQQLGALTAEVANIKTQLDKQDRVLTEMRDVIVASKGSWKMLGVIGGLLVTITSILTTLIVKFWPAGHN